MTRTLSVNGSNDIFVALDGNLSVAQDEQALLEVCQQVMQARRGEMIYSVDRGIPFDDEVWNTVNIPRFQAEARRDLLLVPGVLAIRTFDANVVDDNLVYRVEIETEFGVSAIGL